MFTKTADTEKMDVLDDAGKVRRVFASLSKDTASELELLRVARTMGVVLPKLSEYTEAGPAGTLRLKR